MTPSELDLLPEIPAAFEYLQEEKIIDGQRFLFPVQPSGPGPMYQKDDDGIFFDARTGEEWEVGWYEGRRVKRRHVY